MKTCFPKISRILPKRVFNRSNWRESKKQERKEGKGEGEKKKSILMFLYRRLFERQKTFPEGKLLTS